MLQQIRQAEVARLQTRAESWEQQARESQGQVQRLQGELVALAKTGSQSKRKDAAKE